jgi:potassium-dependent mechanosensitive channel
MIKLLTRLLAGLLLAGIVHGPVLAKSRVEVIKRVQTHILADLAQQINVDQQSNTITRKKLQQLQKRHHEILESHSAREFSRQLLQTKQLALAEAKATNLNISQLLQGAEQKRTELKAALLSYQEKLRDAQADAVNLQRSQPDIDRLKWRLDYVRTYLDLQTKHIEALQVADELTAEVVRLESEVYEHLLQLNFKRENDIREQVLLKMAAAVQQKRAELLQHLKAFNKKLERFSEEQQFTDPHAIRLSLRIFEAEEEIFIGEQLLRVEHLNDDVADLITLPQRNLTVREIDKYLREIKQLEMYIDDIEKSLSSKAELINSRLDIQHQLHVQQVISVNQFRENKLLLKNLLQRYKKISERAKRNAGLLSKHEASLRTLLNKNIALRQGFPGWHLEEWHTLLQKISYIPASFYGLLKTLRDHVILSFRTVQPIAFLLILLLNLVWVLSYYIGRRAFSVAITALANKHGKVTISVALALLKTLRRHLTLIVALFMVASTFYFLQIPFKTYRFFLASSFVLIVLLLFMHMARLVLFERVSDLSGVDVKIYHRLKWGLVATALVLVFNVFSQEINIDYDVRDFFNRVFMIILCLFSLLLFRLRHFVLSLFIPYVEASKTYVQRAVTLLTWLVPVTLLSNAIVGLSGYLQLAGVMSYYQLMILLVMTAYVILRGVVTEFMELLADATIRRSTHGWLLSQAFLIPLDKVMRLALFIVAWVVLFYSFGWGVESYVVTTLVSIINIPLVNSTSVQITLLSLLKFIMLVVVVFWGGRWSREISYRMLFTEIRDQSMRNSLAAFTRYSTIIIGGFICLQVLGINLSGLSYILGGLAVGLGFGLRDFANNIVSGVMLLIERPVREGDIVTINEHEGVVSRIGLRSLMLKSYDYVEVMVPNAEILNKTFINWTHQDSIARTVLSIKVHRHDDPVQVQSLILDVLRDLPAVLLTPAPSVLMRKLDDALIVMEARYFVDLQSDFRVCVQSDVLFSIWERFKANGIRAPFPQHDVRLIHPEAPQG